MRRTSAKTITPTMDPMIAGRMTLIARFELLLDDATELSVGSTIVILVGEKLGSTSRFVNVLQPM